MRSLAVVALPLVVAACAEIPRVTGGPDIMLPAAFAAEGRVVRLDVEAPEAVLDRYAQTQGRDTAGRPPETDDEAAFRWALSGEIEPELSRCATGSRALQVRVRIEQLTYDERFASLWDGRGEDRIAGVVEFADPAADGAIVGRYRIAAAAPSGKALSRIVSDRTDALAEAFGRSLCLQAFGRNPRGPAIENSTPD